MGIGSKLSQLLDAHNTNANELANKIGVSPQTIYSIIKRDSKKADIEVLLKIADIFGVDAEYFVYDERPNTLTKQPQAEFSKTEISQIEKYRFISQHSPAGRETVDYIMNREYTVAKMIQATQKKNDNIASFSKRIISYYYKNASAGSGQLIIDNLPEKDIEIPDIQEYRNVSYAIGVNGSSMEPAYHDGDILLVEATRKIEIGDIGIFQIDGECYVKELGETELISLNKDYPNIPLNETAQTMGKVIGKL